VSFTSQNHYVPQWYQKRFYPPNVQEKKVFYLDKHPDRVAQKNGSHYARKAIRRLGTKQCFKQEHLYTLFFRDFSSDDIEKKFFGVIDACGAEAVEFFSHYEVNGHSRPAYQDLMRFMDVQKTRTPKGFDYLKTLISSESSQQALAAMQSLWQIHITIWSESVWEIVNCHNSDIKFLMSDHPVVTYNKRLFPGSASCLYPFDAEIQRLGTHTIFPLDWEHCLILTNLGYVRNPKANGLKTRENPRYFQPSVFDLRKIQTEREIPTKDVLAINYILKNRAKRYVAAYEKRWLFPEKEMSTTNWNKLGTKYFLFPDPRKVSFTTGFFAGNDDGPTWAQDEYGRIPDDENANVKRLRDKEWTAFHRFQEAWDSMHGPLSDEEFRKYI